MSTHHSRIIGATATALAMCALLATTAAPASAKLDAGPALERQATPASCPLERVGTQLVRCDDLTGNGQPAPQWIPQR